MALKNPAVWRRLREFLMVLSTLPCSWREEGCGELLRGRGATPRCRWEGGCWLSTEVGGDIEANICAPNMSPNLSYCWRNLESGLELV